jgi:hypothetical protein
VHTLRESKARRSSSCVAAIDRLAVADHATDLQLHNFAMVAHAVLCQGLASNSPSLCRLTAPAMYVCSDGHTGAYEPQVIDRRNACGRCTAAKT